MKPQAPVFLALAATSLLAAHPSLLADQLKPRITLGMPKEQATLGMGFDTRDSHLALALSPDGKTLASASLDGTVCLFDATTGKEQASFKEESRRIWSVAFSPDGKTLALGGWEKEEDKAIGIVSLCDVASRREKLTFEKRRYGVYSVAFSRDGNAVASGGDDRTVRLWDVSSGREQAALSKQPAESVLSVAFSPDGKMLAAGGGSVEPTKDGKFSSMIRVWDVASRKEIASLQGHTHWVSSVAFSPDSKTLASGSYDDTVRLWEVASGKQKTIFRGRHEPGFVLSVAFSPDGKTVAVGGVEGIAKVEKAKGAVRLWDVTTGEEKLTLSPHGPFVTSVVFSPDGKTLASGSGDTTVKLWSVPEASK